MKNYIYSYRITYFGGTAPCYTGKYLSLAICKRDMRRVIGNRFHDSEPAICWIIGIVGCGLEKNTKNTYQFHANNILYIAKISDAIPFSQYFANINEKRKDKIYIPSSDNGYHSNGITFKHIEDSNIHIDKNLQDRDWDTTHCNSEKYALISHEYRFLSKEESDMVINKYFHHIEDAKLAKSVGHTWFSCEDNKLTVFFNNLICQGIGTTNLPTELRNCTNYSSCGKDKGI